MHPRQNQPKDIGETLGAVLGEIILSYYLTLHVFLRRGFGEQRCQPWHVLTGLLYIGLFAALYGVVAMPVKMFIASQTGDFSVEETNYTPLLLFAAAYPVALVLHAWPHWRRFVTDRFVRHYSDAQGVPRLAPFFPQLKEFQVRLFAEPVIVSGLGVLVCGFSGPLGAYLILGGLSLFSWEWTNHAAWRGRINALIGQQMIGEWTSATLRENVDEHPGQGPEDLRRVVQEAFDGKSNDEVSYDEMVRRLDPELRKLMAPSPAPSSDAGSST